MSQTVHFQGNPVSVQGTIPQAGAKAQPFTLVAKDLSDVALSQFAGSRKLGEARVGLDKLLAALECLVARHFDGGAHLFEARLVEPAFVFDDVLHRVRGLRGDGEGLALCLRLEARGLRG